MCYYPLSFFTYINREQGAGRRELRELRELMELRKGQGGQGGQGRIITHYPLPITHYQLPIPHTLSSLITGH
jgi:hypothetical protein